MSIQLIFKTFIRKWCIKLLNNIIIEFTTNKSLTNELTQCSTYGFQDGLVTDERNHSYYLIIKK